MYKLITVLTTGLVMTTSMVFASPVTTFEKGALNLELGGTLNSKVSGRGQVTADVTGKSGYKFVLTAGLSNQWALQYKQGMFTSKTSTISGINTYAEAAPHDVNVLYKINPDLTFITGYENNKISYGSYVSDATKSALHFGLTGTHKLNDNATLFATLISGKDVSLREIGVSYQLSKITTLNMSYAERKSNNVDLNVPLLHVSGTEDYTMSGISCLFDIKL